MSSPHGTRAAERSPRGSGCSNSRQIELNDSKLLRGLNELPSELRNASPPQLRVGSQPHRRVVRRATPYSTARQVWIDKIVLQKVPLRIDFENGFGFDHQTLVYSSGSLEMMPGLKVHARITGQSPDDGDTGFRRALVRVEFNPSRVAYLDPADGHIHGGDLCDILGEPMTRLFAEYGMPNTDLLAPGVFATRLDLARDFDLGDVPAGRLLHELHQTDCRKGMYAWLGRELYDNRPVNMLKIERQAWKIVLYDQKSLHGPDFPTDLRCELRLLKGRHGKRWNVRRPEYVSPWLASSLLRHYFNFTVCSARTPSGRLDFDEGRLVEASV